MKIVTGYTGTPHITSNDDQAFNQGVFGTGNYVLNIGQKFKATLANATTVTIEDGEGVMQGVHFRIEPGTTENVAISSGTTGYNRVDLICARYTKDAVTGVEDVSLVVVEGTPTTSTPSAPSYNSGNILNGETLADFPLWKVTITGLTPALTCIYGVYTATTGLFKIYEGQYNVPSRTEEYKILDDNVPTNTIVVTAMIDYYGYWATQELYINQSTSVPHITFTCTVSDGSQVDEKALVLSAYNNTSAALAFKYRVITMEI